MNGGVLVSCTARLHLGFLDPSGVLGRCFGSLGLTLDGPETRIRLRRGSRTVVAGAETERAARYLETVSRHWALASHYELNVISAIPAHSGLGSGTQLALAIAAAVRRLHDIPDDPADNARTLGRGKRSGIGIASFMNGGFVVDGGRGENAASPPLVARMAVPETWRIILVCDRNHRGLAGRDEVAAFAKLPPFGSERAAEICHLVLMRILPALADDDLTRFGTAITRIQRLLGDHFAPVQGGRIASPRVAAVLELLISAGATGAGQSSWGPTGFSFIRGETEAKRIADLLRRSGPADGLEIEIRRPLNRGAVVTDIE